MLANKNIMAFLATTNAEKAKTFYQETLGLRLIEEHEFSIVFDANGIELRLQKSQAFTPHTHTSLGWSVEDISETIKELSAKGIEFIRYEGMGQDDTGIWHTPAGTKIAWFKDPYGNLLSLTQG